MEDRLRPITTPLKKLYSRLKIRKLNREYEDKSYRDYYAAVMKERIAVDPQYAVGGQWEKIGRLQFDFLADQGLQPQHYMLDFGCGSLRGGLRFIDHLEPGHYTGVDISEDVLEVARMYLAEAGLEDKNPALMLIDGLSLDELAGHSFDFILAQSVLTHMPPDDIQVLFSNISNVMHADSLFFATYFDGGDDHSQSSDRLNFYYPFDMLAAMASESELSVLRSTGYRHPRGQAMMKIRPNVH